MNSSPAIVCIGEILWDMLPTGRQPGGAPFHVARELQRLGQSVQLISRVGDDELGAELLAVMAQLGLDGQLVQRSRTHLTGVVKVNQSSSRREYKIVEPVAWDYVQHTDELRELVADSQMLVYGSLAARSAATRETLYRLLQVAPYKVFDMNLRAPHYTRTVVQYLLRQADLVKLNEQELQEIMGWLGQLAMEETALPWLAQHYGLQAVCLTKEAGGATLWHNNTLLYRPSSSPQKADGLGSSDAFLATLLSRWVSGRCLQAAFTGLGPPASGQAIAPAA
jgi:fructokinase